MLLKDQVVIITGAASLRGIGFATAQRCVEEGARVALLDLKQDATMAAANTLGAEHRGYACDVRDAVQCQTVVQHIIQDFGHIDALVNNAGVSQAKRLMDSTMEDYDIVMDANLRGTYNMSRAVVPHLRERSSGSIACMGSVAAQRGGGLLGGPHYCAAKGGVISLAKAMARELAPDGIRVNAVAPSMTDTDLLLGKIDEAGKTRVAADTPLGRIATPVCVANVFIFLLSDLASYVTGAVIDVNGGLHIH